MIPVLDMSAFRSDPRSHAGQAFAAELTEACHEVGFVHLTGHGVPATLEAAVHDVARAFFALPESERLEIANTNTPHFRGYTRLGMEHTNGVSDWRDQIDIGPELEDVDVGPNDPRWLRLRGPNQWPSALPAMRPAVSDWMDRMSTVGADVLRALAMGLDQPDDLFAPLLEPHPEVLVKIIRYPAQDQDRDTGQGVGEHHDSGLVSFILQDDLGGLEVRLGDELVPVAPRAGALVLNLGEMLQLATNGYLRATRHRVVSPAPGRERISAAYFFNPSMESALHPIDLPPALAARARGGQNVDPNDPVFSTYGENWLKFRLRSHPDVAAIHHADLLSS